MMNSLKTVFLMTLLAVIMMAIGGTFGGRQGVYIMFLDCHGNEFFLLLVQ